jgi:peptide/nickel transport system substrate-binding protein
MQSYLGGYFGDIVGAQAYMAGKAPHIAGIVARRNRLLIRLRAPAGDLPARLAMPIACAVPLGTPLDPGGVRLIPSAGPYFVASYTPGQGVVLERNPNYSGNRPHRLGRIEVAFGLSSHKAAAQIESGGADYALEPDAFPPGESARLAARYGPGHTANGAPRYFLNPRPSVHFLLLNTHRPLFRGLRLRRAVNFAVDRRTLARIGPAFQSAAQPTDQYLPPGTPGFRDVRVYPSTPDLPTARRLAGDTSRTAVLYACNESTCRRLAQAVKTQLRAIGIRVDVKAFPSRVLYDKYATGSYDLALASWFPDYADPSAALDAAVEGGFGLPMPALAPVYRRTLAAAATLSGPARYIAYRRLDAELAQNAAPWVAYANSLSTDFFSSRIGCQVYQPVYGMDLAGLCIRRR